MSLQLQIIPNNTQNLIYSTEDQGVYIKNYDELVCDGRGGAKYKQNVRIDGSFSISVLFKFTNLKNVHIVDMRKSDAIGYQPLYIFRSPAKIQYACGTSKSEFTLDTSFETNTWYNIVIRVNQAPARIQCSVNGVNVQKSTSDTYVTQDPGEFPLYLGQRYQDTSNSYHDGSIRDFRLYNHELSDAEVAELAKDYNPYLTSTYEFHTKGLVENDSFTSAELTKYHLGCTQFIETNSTSLKGTLYKNKFYVNEFIED